MTILNLLNLLCGLAMFLFGMHVMSEGLKKSAGSRLKIILSKMTSNPWKGFLLGTIVTAIVQSSSATTVMVVGFVNSGTMSLAQSVGITYGAEIGAAITNWLTALSGIDSHSGVGMWLSPSAWMPILALIGIGLLMFSKKPKKQDFATVLLGFSVLMVGMDMMSHAVSPLKDSASFQQILTMFQNPLFGVLAGTVITAVIQSSSASIGILQTLSTTGAVTWGMAIPIVMGQNIGTCMTALLASIGANREGKRAAFVHLFFNVIGTVIWLSVYCIVKAFIPMNFINGPINMWEISIVNTVFKVLALAVIAPLTKQLLKLVCFVIRNKEHDEEKNPLDERLFATPAVAVESAEEVTCDMARISGEALISSLDMLSDYNEKVAEEVRSAESKADIYEDELGSYLVKLAGQNPTEQDSHEISKLLRLIGDFERISDHAVNLLESMEELRDKKIDFSQEAKRELSVLSAAVKEIVSLSVTAFTETDLEAARKVEPLEQVIDALKEQIKTQHILRLQKSECTIEHGFVLSDILTNLERVSDHCSNIAGCVIEISKRDAMDMHRYLDEIKHSGEDFDRKFKEYKEKYSL